MSSALKLLKKTENARACARIFLQMEHGRFCPFLRHSSSLYYLVKILTVEPAPKITVNGIAPGMVLLTSQSMSQLQKIKQKTLLKKLGSPDDVAQAVLFLLQKGGCITGEIFRIDGGIF